MDKTTNKTIGHTMGIFNVSKQDIGRYTVHSNTEPHPICITNPWLSEDSFSDSQNMANAELIAEAFNVSTETGKTPKQLAEENERLREALQMAYDFFSPISNQFAGRETIKGQYMLSSMRSALKTDEQ